MLTKSQKKKWRGKNGHFANFPVAIIVPGTSLQKLKNSRRRSSSACIVHTLHAVFLKTKWDLTARGGPPPRVHEMSLKLIVACACGNHYNPPPNNYSYQQQIEEKA